MKKTPDNQVNTTIKVDDKTFVVSHKSKEWNKVLNGTDTGKQGGGKDNEGNNTQKTPENTTKLTPRQEFEGFLNSKYDFRYNTILGSTEWKEKGQGYFTELNDYKLNSIARETEMAMHKTISSDRIRQTLLSDFVLAYNPIKEYFENLPPTTGNTNINILAATVTVEKQELFEKTLQNWLVATIANALTPTGCQNQTCFTLTGGQGLFKTKWLELLIPPSLKKYLFSGKISVNTDNKDTLIYLATMLIINLDDQLRVLNKKDSETLKTYITQGEISIRRPFDKLTSRLPRMASFCGSVNGNDFLTDTTGARRFYPFEVVNIDIENAQNIDMNKVWAEAYSIYLSGERYWLTSEEHKELFEGNEEFQVFCLEEELINTLYYVPQENEKFSLFTTNDVLDAIQKRSDKTKINQYKVGQVLNKIGAKKVSVRVGKGNPVKKWKLAEIMPDEPENQVVVNLS